MSLKRIITSLALVSALGVGVAACEVPEDTKTDAPSAKVVKKAKAKAAKVAEQTQTVEAAEPTETIGQENARQSAESYLDYQAFSRSGLIHQLKYEGFSKANATYAVEVVSPNWNKQAAKSAKSYLKHQSFSASGLQDQLEYEGFTPSQAAYGVSAVGY